MSKSKYKQAENSRRWAARNPLKRRANNLTHKHKLKMDALSALGKRCVGFEGKGCPWNCDDPRLLTFDHIRGDGFKAKWKSRFRAELRELLDSGLISEKLQILCLYCHALKTSINGEHAPGRQIAESFALFPLLDRASI